MSLIKKSMEVVFDKKRKPAMFLANFFTKKQLDGIKLELQGRQVKALYSVDVKLGTGGRRVELSNHETKEYTVPEYNDHDVITEVDMFNTQLGETEYTKVAASIAGRITDKQENISDMQRRAEEKQASDSLFTGQIALAGGNKIEFNKKDTHTISKSAAKWNTAGGNPVADIIAACKLCVVDGMVSSSVFNLILEDSGLSALLANAKFIANSSAIAGIKRSDINIPEEQTPGALFHGQFSVGSFIINLWTYNEKYMIPVGFDLAGEGTEVGYIPEGYGLVLPMKPNFRRYYGAVNSVDASTTSNIGGAKLSLQSVEQLPYAYDVVKGGSAYTEVGVKSRPLYVPADIDSFATFKDLV